MQELVGRSVKINIDNIPKEEYEDIYFKPFINRVGIIKEVDEKDFENSIVVAWTNNATDEYCYNLNELIILEDIYPLFLNKLSELETKLS